MSRPFDLLRSLVRSGAVRAGERVRRLAPADAVRRTVRELGQQRVELSTESLTSAVAHAPDVEAASVASRDGKLWLDVGYEDGATLHLALVPEGASFAPRGAKELRFRIEPAEHARSQRVGDLVSQIAGAVARGLWPLVASRGTHALGGAPVDREASGHVRVDLRSVPAVRALEQKGPFALMLEAIDVRRMTATEAGLVLELRLPGLGI